MCKHFLKTDCVPNTMQCWVIHPGTWLFFYAGRNWIPMTLNVRRQTPWMFANSWVMSYWPWGFLSRTLIIKTYIVLKYNTHLICLFYLVLVCVQVHTPIMCPSLSLSSLFVLKMDLSLILQILFSTKIAGRQTTQLFLSPPSSALALQVCMTMLGFLHGYWGSECGHSCLQSRQFIH